MKLKFLLSIIILFVFNSYSINYLDSIQHNDHLLLNDSIITGYILKNDCKTTIQDCSKTGSETALRLENFIAWLIIRNKSKDEIFHQLDKRLLSFYPEDSCSFTNPVIKPSGDPKSPIKIRAYVKSSCSLCKRVVIPLYIAVNSEILKGIASLEIRPMSDTPGDRALLAAEKQNRGWDFFLSLENEDRRLDDKIIMELAKKLNLNIPQFKKDYTSTETFKTLRVIHNEAGRNNFHTTPTLYIDNHRYQSYKDPQWVIDAIELKYNSMKGKN